MIAATDGAAVVICNYCGDSAQFLATSEQVYDGRNFGPVWACLKCEAWVGVHPGTKKPLGRLANSDLRQAKRRAHSVFDPLWMHAREAYDDKVHSRRLVIRIARSRAYLWLAEQLGIPVEDCHIGMFDVAQCRRVVEVVKRSHATPRSIRAWAHGHAAQSNAKEYLP